MNISVMMDCAIAAVVLLCAALGWRRGLLRSLAELAVMIAALVLANQIANGIAPIIVDRALRPAAYSALEARLDELDTGGMLSASPMQGAKELVEAIPNEFVREHALALLEENGLLKPVNTKEAVLEMGRTAVDEVLESVALGMVRSLLCGALFMIFTVLLRMAVRALLLAVKLPGLKQLNELGGLLLGVGKGLLLVCLGVWALRLAGVITLEMAEGSRLLELFPRWISQL